MSMPNYVLKVENVNKSYFSSGFGGLGKVEVPVLSNISFELNRGEILSLIGESGSGKTTIARCIMNREKIQRGSIQCLSGSIQEAGVPGIFRRGYRGMPNKKLLGSIQLVPQATQNNLNPYLDVRRHLMSIITRRGYKSEAAKDRMGEILGLTGLDDGFLDRYPPQLSGGQSQRLLIARAIAMEPEVIIFDEPVSSLDVSIQARILNMLIRLKDACQLSYIFISHDLDIAEYISDRIAVLHQGRLIEIGDVSEVVHNPRHQVTRDLISAGLKKDMWIC